MTPDPTDSEDAGPPDSSSVRKRVGPKVVNAVRDNVEVALFDSEKLQDSIGDSNKLDNRRAIRRLQMLRSEGLIEPDGLFTEHNAIVKPYRENLAELINPEITASAESATHMAFGDNSTATDPSDTHLINEVYRQQIDDHVTRQADDEYAATVLIQSNDAVNESLLEAALVNTSDPTNSSDRAFNRVILSDPQNRLDPKTSDFAVTVTVEISYLDESQVV